MFSRRLGEVFLSPPNLVQFHPSMFPCVHPTFHPFTACHHRRYDHGVMTILFTANTMQGATLSASMTLTTPLFRNQVAPL